MAGKGGVGKTTVTAVLARAANDAGLRVLVVELDGKPALRQLVPDLPFLSLTASDALADIAHASPREIIDHFVRAGDAWASGRPQDDDVTFVVLKVK